MYPYLHIMDYNEIILWNRFVDIPWNDIHNIIKKEKLFIEFLVAVIKFIKKQLCKMKM